MSEPTPRKAGLPEAARVPAGIFVLFTPILCYVGSLVSGQNLWLSTLLALTVALVIHLAMEHRFPFRTTRQIRAREVARDLWYAIGYTALFGASACAAAWWLLSFGSVGGGGLWHPAWLVAGIVVLGDAIDYGRHRLEHASSGVLWRLHAVHHSIERFDTLHGTRVHPLEPAFVYASYGIAGGLLGADLETTLTAMVLVVLIMTPQHIDIDSDIGWLRNLIVFTDAHRWHHDRDTRPSRNLGSVFTVWDRLFGTYQAPIGFDRSMGVAGEPALPDSLLGQALVAWSPRPDSPMKGGRDEIAPS